MFKPGNYTSVSPYLIVTDARATLAFAAAVFDAPTLFAQEGEDGAIRHAEFQIDDSVLMVGQATEAAPAHIHVYLADPDAAYARALAAGAREAQPMQDQPDGDRRGGITDLNGTTWWLARAIAPRAPDRMTDTAPPAWFLPGPFPPEFDTDERCSIIEELNDPACPEVSLARARVAPGVTTRDHLLRGTIERYVIRSGRGRVKIGGAFRDVGPGDRVLIPADVPQRITNTGTTDLIFHCVCTPRFRAENYVDLGD